MAGPVHSEVYIRKTAPAPWSLLMATEDRKTAIETAEDLLRDGQACAVRVTKETLDPDTMEFASSTVLTRGAPEVRHKRVVPDDPASISTSRNATSARKRRSGTIDRLIATRDHGLPAARTPACAIST